MFKKSFFCKICNIKKKNAAKIITAFVLLAVTGISCVTIDTRFVVNAQQIPCKRPSPEPGGKVSHGDSREVYFNGNEKIINCGTGTIEQHGEGSTNVLGPGTTRVCGSGDVYSYGTGTTYFNGRRLVIDRLPEQGIAVPPGTRIETPYGTPITLNTSFGRLIVPCRCLPTPSPNSMVAPEPGTWIHLANGTIFQLGCTRGETLANLQQIPRPGDTPQRRARIQPISPYRPPLVLPRANDLSARNSQLPPFGSK